MKTHLSPLNFRGLIATMGETAYKAAAAKGQKKRNRALECWRCPECREVFEWEDEAEECCAKPAGKEERPEPTCPVCSEEYGSQRDASDCCLWKDIAPLVRWQMADAVEAGSTWAEQLGIAATAQIAPTPESD